MSDYCYYFGRSRPEFVTGMLERKHAQLLRLSTEGRAIRTMCEVGPGEGFTARAAHRIGIEYRAIEASPIGADRLRSLGIDVALATVPPIPPMAPVDLLYASHVIEHLPGPQAVVDFLVGAKEVLTVDGYVAVVVPDSRWMRWDFYESDFTHQWPTSPRRVVQASIEAGLAVDSVHHMCLHLSGGAGLALRLITRLYPQRLMSLADRSRDDFWYRGKLLLAPDTLLVLRPQS